MSYDKKIYDNGTPTLHKQYLNETFDAAGHLTRLTYNIPEHFNFAYDVIDVLGRTCP